MEGHWGHSEAGGEAGNVNVGTLYTRFPGGTELEGNGNGGGEKKQGEEKRERPASPLKAVPK